VGPEEPANASSFTECHLGKAEVPCLTCSARDAGGKRYCSMRTLLWQK
jgi:hypothetical protein